MGEKEIEREPGVSVFLRGGLVRARVGGADRGSDRGGEFSQICWNRWCSICGDQAAPSFRGNMDLIG